MSSIPEPWRDWFGRLSETLTELDQIAHRYNASIQLPAPTDVLMAEEAPGITARDEWFALIKEATSECAVRREQERFGVYYCFAVDELAFEVLTGWSAEEFPHRRLTGNYLNLLGLFQELRSLRKEMARSFSSIGANTLLRLIPRRYVLQDLLITVGRTIDLTPPQAALALGLDPFVFDLFAGATEACSDGLDFRVSDFSCTVGLAWEAYMRGLSGEEMGIQSEASKNGMQIEALDYWLLEQILVWSYLADDRLPEAIAILTHLLRKHRDDSESDDLLGIGPEDYAEWLGEAIGRLAATGEVAEPVLIDLGGFADVVSQGVADREEGHRSRVEDRLRDVWSDLHHHTQRCLTEAEKQWSRVIESSSDGNERRFSAGHFASFAYTAIENENKQRFAGSALSVLPASPWKLVNRVRKSFARPLLEAHGGDSHSLCGLLERDELGLLRQWRNASLHGGTVEVKASEAHRLYDALWGLGTQDRGWLLDYFEALPNSSASGD